MASNDMYEFGSVCVSGLGITASWRRKRDYPVTQRQPYWSLVVIQSCSGTEDGMFKPAESVTIVGDEALRALRNAIDEALKHPKTEGAAA